MLWKIYLVGTILYFAAMIVAGNKIRRKLDATYQESEEFKETIDTFTRPIPVYDDKTEWQIKVEAVCLGLCPIVHWIGAVVWVTIITDEELLDTLIRRALDKILN